MFDTVKPYYYISDMVCDRLSDDKALKRNDVKIYGNLFYLKHPFGYKNPEVYFNLESRKIWIESSFPKLLQGHNVFGSNRLEYLCIKVLELIFDQLGLKFSAHERHLVLNKRIDLGRVDTACSFRLSSPNDVTPVTEAFWEQLRAEGRDWATEGTDYFETVYHRKHSTRVAEKFYAKYCELQVRRRRIPEIVKMRDEIMEYARNLIRFEVTWRAPELRRIGLQYADNWTPEIVRKKIMDRLNQFNLQGQITQRLAPRHLDKLNKPAQTFYDLWTRGSNLSPYREYAPLKRVRRHLLKHHDVDIFRHPEAASSIALNEVLTEDNAYFVGPKALARRGLIVGVGSFGR